MRAAEPVQEQTLALELLVPQLPVGAILVQADGGVAASNERGRTLLGDGRVDRLGAVQRALQGDATHSERLRLRDDEGRRIVVDVIAVPLRAVHGGVLVLLSDVTEQARQERAEADFVENAAHQLRTPVTAIAASVAALEAGARDEPEERDRFLAHVGRESRRLSRLVEALLRLAGLQRGDGRAVLELVPLDALIAEALDDFPHAAVECAPDLAVIGDRKLLAQAFGNVLSNATQHTDDRGIRVRCSRDPERVVVDVTDFGPGVHPHDRDRLFDRFYRSSASSHPGSGLGLAVARAAVEAMDATLEVLDPREGEGATFRFTFPAARLL